MCNVLLLGNITQRQPCAQVQSREDEVFNVDNNMVSVKAS